MKLERLPVDGLERIVTDLRPGGRSPVEATCDAGEDGSYRCPISVPEDGAPLKLLDVREVDNLDDARSPSRRTEPR